MQLVVEHIYKIYSPAGDFLGILPNVSSPFRYRQVINTPVVNLTIKVGQTMDIANQPVVPLETETGETITTEDDQVITTETAIPLIGPSNSDALIVNDNIVVVYEYSDYYPNGKIVYQGYIASWEGVLGSDEDLTINCFSDGQDTQHFLAPGSSTDIQDVAQTSFNTGNWFAIYETGTYQRAMQTFVPTSSAPNISKIKLKLAAIGGGTRTATVKLWSGAQNYRTGTPLATTSTTVTGTTPSDYEFIFATPLDVSSVVGLRYTINADPSSTSTAYIRHFGSSSNTYSSGDWYVYDPTTTISATNDTYFVTYYNTPTTENTYTDQDVSSGMLEDIMDYYVSSGGSVAKQSGGYTASGVVTTYTFKINTIYEAIRKIHELGPADWYWYIDVAEKVLVYRQVSSTADHTLVKGRDVLDFMIEATKEDIVNVSYFSGGDDGTGSGENIFINVNDTASLAVNRRGIARISDNRVKDTDGISAGTILAQNEIDANSSEKYAITVQVKASTVDLTLLKPGDTATVTGNNNFIDGLVLQIVEVDRRADSAILRLGYPEKRATAKVERLQKQLNDLQTVDNPATPS
jgi:hypothetical protein